uniref:Uncharacterized protein n=1 Tax=Caenorhabditis japonica TaxID=281687 RepID=A0A8R1IWA6_CAEJA
MKLFDGGSGYDDDDAMMKTKKEKKRMKRCGTLNTQSMKRGGDYEDENENDDDDDDDDGIGVKKMMWPFGMIVAPNRGWKMSNSDENICAKDSKRLIRD